MSVRMMKAATAGVAMFVMMGALTPAEAGGLFGKKGIIGGWVGKMMTPVQERLLTPVVRAAVVVGAGAAGGAIGTMVGQPLAGEMLGAGLGEAANEAAR